MTWKIFRGGAEHKTSRRIAPDQKAIDEHIKILRELRAPENLIELARRAAEDSAEKTKR